MKKIFLCFGILVMLTAGVSAQASFVSATTTHYTVWVTGDNQTANALAERLEKLFELFNTYFRFDTTMLKGPLTVRMFADKTAFDAYVQKVTGQAKEDFVYIHYPTVERSELVIFSKADVQDFDASLAHQAFVQFIKAFVAEPPVWIREGFAVYFERVLWDPATKTLSFMENDSWLETVKILQTQNKLVTIEKLLSMNSEEATLSIDVFYPQSWAFISFLLNSEKPVYQRFMWDVIASLRANPSDKDMPAKIKNYFVAWYSKNDADIDFAGYIKNQKTFAEYITAGVQAYTDKNYDVALTYFLSAVKKNPDNYIAHYYLGLIAYAKNDYARAEEYYKTALALGSDQAITYYALGINAFASKRFEDAKTYLNKAAEIAPDKYADKVKELLARIEAGG